MDATASLPVERWDAELRMALEANGQRVTEQRTAVYRSLRSSSEHPTADEVFTAVRADISDISLATVYKALEALVSCGLARKLAYGDGSARYDSRTDDHFHSRCTRCGAVRDLPDHPVPGRIELLPLEPGFEVQALRLEVIGTCSACRS